jgi:acyl-CoA hydrolase
VTAPADKALPIPVEPRGELTVRVAAMPADTNANGDIFGGWVLSQMDAAGGIASAEYAKGRVVTIAIDAMTFIRPVKVGDVLCVYTAIDGVGRTSMKVHVEAWARLDLSPPGRPKAKYNGSAPASEDRARRRAGALRSWTESGRLPYWPRKPPLARSIWVFLDHRGFAPHGPKTRLGFPWISLDSLVRI